LESDCVIDVIDKDKSCTFFEKSKENFL